MFNLDRWHCLAVWRTSFCFALLVVVIGGSAHAQSSEVGIRFETVDLLLDGHLIFAEIAKTESQREQGLSGRTKLAPNRGMLFVFDKQEVQYFWMKGTHFDLDLAFFDDQLELIEITELQALDERIYTSRLPARTVLELPIGWLESHGVSLGARLKLADGSHAELFTNFSP